MARVGRRRRWLQQPCLHIPETSVLCCPEVSKLRWASSVLQESTSRAESQEGREVPPAHDTAEKM